MAIYLYQPDADRYRGVGLLSNDAELLQIKTKPIPVKLSWIPRIVSDYGVGLLDGDFPTFVDFMSIPVMSERAWNVLAPLIGNFCEALPLIRKSGQKLFLIHVMKICDCLDHEKSQVRRYKSGDRRVYRIDRFAFRDEYLKFPIFMLPIEDGSQLFVNDHFRSIVEAESLMGLVFESLPMR